MEREGKGYLDRTNNVHKGKGLKNSLRTWRGDPMWMGRTVWWSHRTENSNYR